MNTVVLYLYGLAGIIVGYKIPYFSFKIMEYKKGKENVSKCDNFLYSKLVQFIICLFNGGIWFIAGLRSDNPFTALLIGIMITTGLIIAFIDINIRIIPNEIILFVIIIGIIFQVVNYSPKSILTAIISMMVMMAVFTSVAGFVGFGKVGAGDVKLAGAMGLSLGYPLIITAVGAMAIVLLVFIGIGLLSKKLYLSTMLPLAPFIISGFIVSLFTVLL